LSTVQLWVARAAGKRLDRVNWSDLPGGPSVPPGRTSGETEDLVLQVRRELRETSDLGEFGAAAILMELLARRIQNIPAVRTIGYIRASDQGRSAGGMLAIDSMILHSVGRNDSDKTRMSMTAGYCSVDERSRTEIPNRVLVRGERVYMGNDQY